jgi:hypothetical protein
VQKKELVLHCDVKAGDRMLFFTTTGWMMWQWSTALLSVSSTTLITYDGSPGYPGTKMYCMLCGTVIGLAAAVPVCSFLATVSVLSNVQRVFAPPAPMCGCQSCTWLADAAV